MTEKEYIDLYECRDDFYATVLDILSEDNTNDRANQIIDAFDCLPAADVEPVKHGEWCGTVCSACGESTSFYYDCDYCPHCGAKMTGGEEND